jgi:alkanesulfonate monooxygenase SsuD/methylene tetrahydromethanopterin reductase-like flavin-dependent oxidoreductase (luciferase family)
MADSGETRESVSGLRIGLTADSPTMPGAWDHVLEKARLADQLGFDSIWLGEAWGYELFTSLADLIRVTTQVKIGAGVANVFSRSPAVIASSVATLDERSGGRIILGLGTSGPQVIEHWHGIKYDRPLRRLREYVDVVKLILRREPLVYHGEVFQLERGFTLRFRPVRSEIPIYLASLSPKSIELAGQIANGVLPVHWPAPDFPGLRADLDRAAEQVGRTGGATRVAPYVVAHVVLDEADRAAERRQARGPVAFYAGRMGTFYASMLTRHGFGDDVEAIKRGWESGHSAAFEAVSDRLLDATAIVGTPAEVVARLHQLRALGVDEPLVTMPRGTPEQAAPRLEALAAAAGL